MISESLVAKIDSVFNYSVMHELLIRTSGIEICSTIIDHLFQIFIDVPTQYSLAFGFDEVFLDEDEWNQLGDLINVYIKQFLSYSHKGDARLYHAKAVYRLCAADIAFLRGQLHRSEKYINEALCNNYLANGLKLIATDHEINWAQDLLLQELLINLLQIYNILGQTKKIDELFQRYHSFFSELLTRFTSRIATEKSHDLIWNFEKLIAFLSNPKGTLYKYSLREFDTIFDLSTCTYSLPLTKASDPICIFFYTDGLASYYLERNSNKLRLFSKIDENTERDYLIVNIEV